MIDTMTKEETLTKDELEAILKALFTEACETPHYLHRDQNCAYIDALLDVEVKVRYYLNSEN